MTLLEKIKCIISDALVADQTLLPPEDLDKVTNVIGFASDLIDLVEDVFTDLGSEYLQRVETAFGHLPEDVPLGSVFPKAINLITFLKVVNLLDPDEMGEEIPAELSDFGIYEAQQLTAHNRDGDLLEIFVYQNPTVLADSVALLDLTSAAALEAENTNPRQLMTACTAILIGEASVALAGRRWIVSSIADEARRTSYCKFHLIVGGWLLTSPVAAPAFNSLVGIAETLTGAVEYIQFGEPFEILSEINSRTTVPDTFLSSYHALENYMIRAQIVSVETDSGAALFGIRHFKRMGLAVDKREQEHLTELFTACWIKQIGLLSFSEFVDQQYGRLFAAQGFSEPDFQHYLRLLTVKSANKSLPIADLVAARNALPKIVYQVRCSIVHNKETEFHISNRELANPTLLLMLTELCIPCMQRLAFGLPTVATNNPVRYSRRSLELY